MNTNCGCCKYFVSLQLKRKISGHCHVRSFESGWPTRNESDWCGEHQLKYHEVHRPADRPRIPTKVIKV